MTGVPESIEKAGNWRGICFGKGFSREGEVWLMKKITAKLLGGTGAKNALDLNSWYAAPMVRSPVPLRTRP